MALRVGQEVIGSVHENLIFYGTFGFFETLKLQRSREGHWLSFSA